MEKKYRVGIVGGTGMVGQRFATLLEHHPWFTVTAIAASGRSAGKTYGQAVEGRWMMERPVPQNMKDLVVKDAQDVEAMKREVDFVFCAVDMKKEEIRQLEEAYAKAEVPVVSNNSAHRGTPDVPMVIPEINPEHTGVIPAQRRRLGTERGFIAVKSNCSLQSYVPAIHPLLQYGVTDVLACTYQAISGAGKNFATWPEMVDNVNPFIPGEEEERAGAIEDLGHCPRWPDRAGNRDQHHIPVPPGAGVRWTYGRGVRTLPAEAHHGADLAGLAELPGPAPAAGAAFGAQAIPALFYRAGPAPDQAGPGTGKGHGGVYGPPAPRYPIRL